MVVGDDERRRPVARERQRQPRPARRLGRLRQLDGRAERGAHPLQLPPQHAQSPRPVGIGQQRPAAVVEHADERVGGQQGGERADCCLACEGDRGDARWRRPVGGGAAARQLRRRRRCGDAQQRLQQQVAGALAVAAAGRPARRRRRRRRRPRSRPGRRGSRRRARAATPATARPAPSAWRERVPGLARGVVVGGQQAVASERAGAQLATAEADVEAAPAPAAAARARSAPAGRGRRCSTPVTGVGSRRRPLGRHVAAGDRGDDVVDDRLQRRRHGARRRRGRAPPSGHGDLVGTDLANRAPAQLRRVVGPTSRSPSPVTNVPDRGRGRAGPSRRAAPWARLRPPRARLRGAARRARARRRAG